MPPVEYQWGLIGAYHDRLGHAGISQTLTALRCHFAWAGIKADIAAFIKQCHPCQVQCLEAGVGPQPVRPRMSAPFEDVHVDLAGPFPVRQVAAATGKRPVSTERVGTAYVLLVVDYFTKAAEFVMLPNKQAATVARAFHDRWLMRYGVPVWATTDNGTEFGGAFRHQLERLGVQLVHSAPYHPHSNGAVERVVRTMKTILAAKVVDAMHDWPALLPQVQGEYMSRVHAVTGYIPNQLVFSHAVKMPPPVGGLL